MNRTTWLIAGLGLAAAAIIIIMASPRASAWQIGDTYSGSGDWTINNPTEVGAETVTVTGNLNINAKLTMYNARINIDSGTTDGLYTVNVAAGQTLNIWGGSTLTAANGAYHYKFTVYGILDVNGSTVSEMWGDTTWWTGGIQLYNSGSTIRGGSSVTLGKTGGICIVNVTATITDSSIFNNGAGGASTTFCYGILASSNGATATTINNCRIYGNTYTSGSLYGYGVISNFQTAADSITNCFIYNNGGGTLATNAGYQLYLQYSKVTISNDYLGNGSYGLYAVESSPPTITNTNINSYTYNSPTYGVWAYNSTLAFQGCNFATTYVSSTQYGVYASGPSENSISKLAFTTCTFTYTLASTAPRYNIYTAGYTPVTITSCTFSDTSGSSVYCVYSGSYGPVDIMTSTMTVSTTTGASGAVYGSVSCPINVTWSTITMTNIAQNMASASTYMIYGFNMSPVKVANCVLSMSLNPGAFTPSYPTFYMIYTANLSAITVSASTMNLATTASGTGYPQSAAYYHIYTNDYSGATVASSWLNFTSAALTYFPTIYTIYAQSYSPVKVTNSNLLDTITYTGTGANALFNMIYGNNWCPITMSGSNLQMTATSSAPSTIVRMLYGSSFSTVAVDFCNINVTGTYSGIGATFYIVTVATNSSLFLNFSTTRIITTNTNTGPYFYTVSATTGCSINIFRCVLNMSENHNMAGGYHYMIQGNGYCPVFIDNSILNFTPVTTVIASGTAFYYPFNLLSYSHLAVNYSTVNVIPSSSSATTTTYFAYPMTYSRTWFNYSFINIAPTLIGGTFNIYGIGQGAGTANYGSIDILSTAINITLPLLNTSATTVNVNYFFEVYSAVGLGSYIAFNNSIFNLTAFNVGYGVYLQYFTYAYYYTPVYMYNDVFIFNVRSFSTSVAVYVNYMIYAYQYSPVDLNGLSMNFTMYGYLCYYYYAVFVGYSYVAPNYIQNISLTINQNSTTSYCTIYQIFVATYLYYYPIYYTNITINITQYEQAASQYCIIQYGFYLNYLYTYSNMTMDNITFNVNVNATRTSAYSYWNYVIANTYSYSYGYELYNRISINVNMSGGTNCYMQYAGIQSQYSYGPVFIYDITWNVSINCIAGYSYFFYPIMVYGYTATPYNSTATVRNCTLNLTQFAYTNANYYGCYYYYTAFNQSDCRFNVNVTSVTTYVTTQYLIAYLIYNYNYSAFYNCTYQVNMTSYGASGNYVGQTYAIYAQYSLVNITDCNWRFNFTTTSLTAGYVQTPNYGFFYIPTSCTVSVHRSALNFAINTWQPQFTLAYVQTGNQLTFDNSTVDFKVRQYVLTSNGYLFSCRLIGGDLQLNNSVFSIRNSTLQSLWGIRTESTSSSIKMNNLTYIASDNLISNYAYHIFAQQCPVFSVNNSRFFVINETGGSPYVANKDSFVIYVYDCYAKITNSTMYLDWRTMNPNNINGSFGICIDGNLTGSVIRPFTVDNCSFYLKCAPGTYGGWLIAVRNGFVNTQITNSYFNITPSSWNAVVFRAQADGTRRVFSLDNCTIDYITPISQGGMGGSVWAMMNYVDLYVNNTKINMRNDAGMFPFAIFSTLTYTKSFFYNDSIIYNVGGGSGTGQVEAQMGYNLAYTSLMNFTRCNITVTARNEPVNLKTFNFNSGKSGIIRFDTSTLTWNINAPGSSAGFLTFDSNPFDPPTVQSLVCLNSKLSMTIQRENGAASLFAMKPGTGLQGVTVTNTPIDLTIAMSSMFPTYAISMDGQKDISLKDLAFKINAPSDTTTVLVGVALTKSSAILFDNFTITGNGQGRITGIMCDMVSLPFIQNCLIQNGYVGIQSSIYSNPFITNTTIANCTYGLVVDNVGNATVQSSTITNVDTAVTITNGSWASLSDCLFNARTKNIDLNQGSTAWLLNTPYTDKPVKFNDDRSTLIINWWLALKVTWQPPSLIPIPGAEVVVRDVNSVEYLKATTGAGGMIPKFSVVEFKQTGLDGATKISFSPYSVAASFGGLSGSINNLVTDRSKEESVIIRDDVFPVLTLLRPDENIIQNFSKVSLSGLASDFGSGVGRLDFSYNDGTGEHLLQSFPATSAWVTTLKIPEGANITIKVTLSDVTGNQVSETRNITVDLTLPFIEVALPAYDSLGNNISVDLKGTVEKGSGLTVNYRPVNVDADGKFSYTVRMVEGQNIFLLAARDLAGNTNSTSWVLRLDVTPPVLVISSPVEGDITNRSSITVTGLTEPGATFTINGAPVEVQWDGQFSVDRTLQSGTNAITAEAWDIAGNHITLVRTIQLDDNVHLEVFDPADNKVTNLVTLVIRGSADTDCLLRLNDIVLAVAPDGNFTLNYILAEGLNTLAFSAVDGAGNSVRIVRRVILDTVDPWMDITSPEAGKTYKSTSVTVKGNCEAKINLTVNGQSVPTDTGSFSLAVTLSEGSNAVTVVGSDAAGNTVTLRLPVQVDSSAPSLDIVEPLGGFRTQDKSVVVVGITEPGASVTVDGVPATVDAFGKFSTSVTLERGRNTITVKASDAAGNFAPDKTVEVIVNPQTTETVVDQSWLWVAVGLGLAVLVVFPLTILFIRISYPQRKKPGE